MEIFSLVLYLFFLVIGAKKTNKKLHLKVENLVKISSGMIIEMIMSDHDLRHRFRRGLFFLQVWINSRMFNLLKNYHEILW
jgi:hypothetical protein